MSAHNIRSPFALAQYAIEAVLGQFNARAAAHVAFYVVRCHGGFTEKRGDRLSPAARELLAHLREQERLENHEREAAR